MDTVRALSQERAEAPVAVQATEFLDDLVRYAYALLGCREDAEDIAVEVCAALHGRKRALAGRDRKRFMLGMARRKVFDRLRARSRRPEVLGLRSVEILRGPDGLPSEKLRLVGEVLLRVPRESADVLVLKYIEELTAEEIGQVVGKSAQAVNSMLQRARAAFAAASDGAFEEFEG